MLNIKTIVNTIITASLLVSVAKAQDYSDYGNNRDRSPGSRFELEDQVKRLSSRIQRITERRADVLSIDELVRLRKTLERAKNIIRGTRPGPGPGPGPIPRINISCQKSSNGRYYPIKDGQIFISTSYNASYSSIQSCIDTMPQQFDTLHCYKQSNGRFYLSNAETGKIVGSNSYNTSYSSQNSCSQDIPAYGTRYTCLKQSNGRYYFSNPMTATILGGSSYNESFSSKSSCTTDLPNDFDNKLCKKQSNGRYYPTNVSDWSIIGSSSYNASYSSKSSCDIDLRYRN
jgi:hypothetical protein